MCVCLYDVCVMSVGIFIPQSVEEVRGQLSRINLPLLPWDKYLILIFFSGGILMDRIMFSTVFDSPLYRQGVET